MSKDRRVRLNYQFLKKCVEQAPVVPIQQEWFDNILELIPTHLKTPKNREVIEDTLREVGENFSKSMQKSLSEFVNDNWRLDCLMSRRRLVFVCFVRY